MNTPKGQVPEALQIANALEREWKADALNYDTALSASAELRRLHALTESQKELMDSVTDSLLAEYVGAPAATPSPQAAQQAPAAQAVTPVVDNKTAGHAMLWRQHCDKLDALVTYCPTCCQGFIAQKEMTRDQIIYECGKTAGRATRPAPPAMDGGEDAEQERPVQRMEGWTDTRYIAELENVARLLRRDLEKLHRVRDALSEKGGR